MDILLISTEDMCRSRIAQELLNSFGRGMKISTAGIAEGSRVPDLVSKVMLRHGYEVSMKSPTFILNYINQSWDYVITLSKEAEEEFKMLTIKTDHVYHFCFDDALSDVNLPDNELEEQVSALYSDMFKKLYEFYRDILSDNLRPRCTCGANDYCRCE